MQGTIDSRGSRWKMTGSGKRKLVETLIKSALQKDLPHDLVNDKARIRIKLNNNIIISRKLRDTNEIFMNGRDM